MDDEDDVVLNVLGCRADVLGTNCKRAIDLYIYYIIGPCEEQDRTTTLKEAEAILKARRDRKWLQQHPRHNRQREQEAWTTHSSLRAENRSFY